MINIIPEPKKIIDLYGKTIQFSHLIIDESQSRISDAAGMIRFRLWNRKNLRISNDTDGEGFLLRLVSAVIPIPFYVMESLSVLGR